MNYRSIIWIIFFMTVTTVKAAEPPVISLEKVLSLAEKNSQSITVDEFNELAARKAIEVAKATYYPEVRFEAIDNTGFPGSSNIHGMRGLMNSPYREGAAAGLVVEQIIWDFGRTTSDVKAAKHEAQYAKENTRVTLYEVQRLALQTFYDCALFKTQHAIWGKLAEESQVITKEALRFVNTGQRSIVDKYISESQTEEARTAHAYFGELMKGTMKELVVIMGIPENSFTCPYLDAVLQSPFSQEVDIYASPYIARAKVGADVAKAELEREKANFMPELLVIASAGPMAGTVINEVEKENYAVGIAVEMPLYNQRYSGQIKEAEAQFAAKQQEVEAQKQYLQEMNAKFDEIINASTIRLQHLHKELKIAQEGYKVAKQRYFSLETDLLDLRETYHILAKVENEVEGTQAQLLQATGAKALLNGEQK